jgi:hypothetical protein
VYSTHSAPEHYKRVVITGAGAWQVGRDLIGDTRGRSNRLPLWGTAGFIAHGIRSPAPTVAASKHRLVNQAWGAGEGVTGKFWKVGSRAATSDVVMGFN